VGLGTRLVIAALVHEASTVGGKGEAADVAQGTVAVAELLVRGEVHFAGLRGRRWVVVETGDVGFVAEPFESGEAHLAGRRRIRDGLWLKLRGMKGTGRAAETVGHAPC